MQEKVITSPLHRDLTGREFGCWTVLGPTDQRARAGTVLWHVRCVCGTERLHRTDSLTCGETHSCGCQKVARIVRDLTGQRFGALVVIEATEKRAGNNVIWRCLCDCGQEHLAPGGELTARDRTGPAGRYRKSCGCQRVNPQFSHGLRRNSQHTKEYYAWKAMKARCDTPYLPCFENYGGRGITVWEGWLHRFDLFFEHIGPAPSAHHSVDRYPDQNGNYEPGNVRWATRREQCNNKRNNRLLTSESLGLTLTLEQWAMRLGGSHAAVQRRLKAGWSVERAVTEPLRKDKRRK